jgi:glycopeptide antibiotics resistance protein
MNNILSFVYASAPEWLYDVLLFVLCVMAVWIFSRRKIIRVKLRRLLGVVYIEYLVLMMCATIIFRDYSTCSLGVELVPFWNYKYYTNEVLWETILNIVMFIPVGFCSAVFIKRPALLKIFLLSMVLSGTIELSQYLLQCGMCETNDLMNNSVGGVLGYLLYRSTPILLNAFRQKRFEYYGQGAIA